MKKKEENGKKKCFNHSVNNSSILFISLLDLYLFSRWTVHLKIIIAGWFMLLYGRNQHNIVKQVSSI